MSKFIHVSTRLYCDLNAAQRMFLIGAKLEKWLCTKAEVENKTNGKFDVLIDTKSGSWDTAGSVIVEKEYERLIKIRMKLPERFAVGFVSDEASVVEINFMQGTSRTEYCTEVHLIHRGFEDSDEGEKAREGLKELWEEALEKLRAEINGDWVIEDRDLTQSCLNNRSL